MRELYRQYRLTGNTTQQKQLLALDIIRHACMHLKREDMVSRHTAQGICVCVLGGKDGRVLSAGQGPIYVRVLSMRLASHSRLVKHPVTWRVCVTEASDSQHIASLAWCWQWRVCST